MKSVRKKMKIDALYRALTAQDFLHAVYRIGRDRESRIAESAYVIVVKKAAWPFEESVAKVVALMRESLGEGESLDFANQSIEIRGEDYVIRYYVEGFRKQCDRKGFVEDGVVQVRLLRRMGVPHLFRQMRALRVEIESYMDDADWKRQYVNAADRYVAIARHLASGAAYPVSADRIDGMLQRGEGRRIEFKSCTNGAYNDTFETICSFMNGCGGDILLGVNDHGTVIGVPKRIVKATVRKIVDVCNDPSRFVARRGAVQVSAVCHHRRSLVHVHVDAGAFAFFDGAKFDRRGEADFLCQYGSREELKARDIAESRRATECRSASMAVVKGGRVNGYVV